MEGKDISLKALYSIIAEEDKDSEDKNKMAERSWSWLGMPLSAIAGGIMAFAGFYYANEANQRKHEPTQTPPQIIEKNSVDYTGILAQFQANITQILDKNNANQENILKQTQAGFAQTLEKTTVALLQVNKDSAANNENLQKQISELKEKNSSMEQRLEEALKQETELKAGIETALEATQKLDADFYYKRGLIKYDYALYEEALKDFDKTVEINPSHSAELYFYRGNSIYLLTKEGILRNDLGTLASAEYRAIQNYAVALSHADLAEVHYNRAILRGGDAGKEEYDYAKKLDPSLPELEWSKINSSTWYLCFDSKKNFLRKLRTPKDLNKK